MDTRGRGTGSPAWAAVWVACLLGTAAPPAQANSSEALRAWWADCTASQAAVRCAAARESTALIQAPGVASRLATRLQLNLGGSAPLQITDAADGSRQHFLLGPLADTDAWLLALIEADRPARFLLVSSGNAQPLHLADLPWAAPGGRLLAVVDESPDQAGNVALLQRAGKRWMQIFRYEPPAELRFQFKGWRADGAALKLGWQRKPSPCKPSEGLIQLRDGPYGWDFVPALPASCAGDGH